MKRACLGLMVAAGVLLSAPLAMAQAAGVAGNWKVSFQSDAGPSEASMVLKQSGAKVTGEIVSDQGAAPLEGTFEGGKLKMTMSIDACGQAFTITFTAVLRRIR